MEKNRLDLSAFDLKLLAMAAMLADHIGYLFFPQALWMRCVGRLAFPIFAFQVAEGWYRTRDRRRYFLRLALCGLLSDGGVHSHIEHLFALLQMAKDKGLTKVYVHCFLDGRDVSPTSGKGFVQALADKCAQLGVGKIATVMGRYYAMDRDKRWERVQMAYDAMVYGEGRRSEEPVAPLNNT